MSQLPVRINDLVQIRILGAEPTSTYASRVDDIISGKLVLSWPTISGVTIPIRNGQPVTLYFIREDAVYNFEAVIDETQIKPVPRIAVRQIGQIQRIQRRAYFRVRAMLPVQLTGIVPGSRSEKKEQAETLHIVTSTVDISGAGMAIHHSTPLPTDTVFEARLAIENDEPPLKFLARVVHSEPIIGLLNERHVYHIAFFFVAITEAQRRKIVRRCFRIQQESLTH